MASYFTSEFFASNRARLRELFTGTAPIVLTANGLLQRNADSAYRFRQDSNFWYLTGLDIPEAVLVIDKDKEYLIIPDQSPDEQVFGSPHDLKRLATRSGIEAVVDGGTGWKRLAARLKRARHVATCTAPEAYLDHYGFYTNPARAALQAKIKELQPAVKFLDLRKHLAMMRMVKQPAELAAIQSAIDTTTSTLKDVQPRLGSYVSEYQIEADITHGFRSRGAEGHAFDPIVAAGKNGSILHYRANNQPVGKGQLVVLDIGAEVENYAADITRTYPVGDITKRQRSVLEAVLSVQEFAFNQLKPGVKLKAYNQAVERFMGEKLRELGLIKVINRKSLKQYYPHSVSHFLGLDVHDAGDYERPLEPGMVLTVEPGIYIREEGIGVRIEDDVLITPGGIENLSAGLPALPGQGMLK